MEQTIIPKFIAEKTSQNTGKKFWVVETDTEKISCFDEKLSNELVNYFNKPVSVEVAQKGEFKNILKILNSTPTTLPITSNSMRENSIIAQCLTKAVVESGMTKEAILETYKYFISELSK
jgi:hypothetical protein